LSEQLKECIRALQLHFLGGLAVDRESGFSPCSPQTAFWRYAHQRRSSSRQKPHPERENANPCTFRLSGSQFNQSGVAIFTSSAGPFLFLINAHFACIGEEFFDPHPLFEDGEVVALRL
jgi:hypothetical protein